MCCGDLATTASAPPHKVLPVVGLAFACAVQARFHEGVVSIRRAEALDPLSLRTGFQLGWCLHEAGRFNDASEQFARVVELYLNAGVARLSRPRVEALPHPVP